MFDDGGRICHSCGQKVYMFQVHECNLPVWDGEIKTGVDYA